MFRLKIGIILFFLTGSALAVNTVDVVTINQVFVKTDGSFAIQHTGVISNASADRDCAPGLQWAKAWAGVGPEVNDRIISVLLSAQAQNKTVQISTNGCQGSWHKIISAYIKP